MDLSRLKDQVKDAARKAAESERVVAVRESAAAQVGKLGPQLRDLVTYDDDRPLSPENLLLKVVHAVHGDDEDLSLKDVRATGKRNERLAAAAGIVGGGVGCTVADLYATAALFWMLADCFDLDLSDEDVAAHLLVAWGALPDLALARAVIDPDEEATIASEARRRLQEELKVTTKSDSIRALWGLRSGVARVPIFEPSTFRDIFLAGRALEQRLDSAARQLGLAPEDIRKRRQFFRLGR